MKFFMIKVFSCLIGCFLGHIHLAVSQKVDLLYDKSSPQAVYAAERLEESLLEHGYVVQGEQEGDYTISLVMDAESLDSEAYSILPEGRKITIKGGDERGIIYGSFLFMIFGCPSE